MFRSAVEEKVYDAISKFAKKYGMTFNEAVECICNANAEMQKNPKAFG
jgi:replication initiation and membrane attachment protein DnaB